MRKKELFKLASIGLLSGAMLLGNPTYQAVASTVSAHTHSDYYDDSDAWTDDETTDEDTTTSSGSSISYDSSDDEDDYSYDDTDTDEDSDSDEDTDEDADEEDEVDSDCLYFGDTEKDGVSITKGKTKDLEYVFDEDLVDEDSISFMTSNKKIAKVTDYDDETVSVKGVAAGTCTIYIAYDGAIIDSCEVTVKASSSTTTYATKISIAKKATMTVGNTKTLKVTVKPTGATLKNSATWTSSNKKVATVSSDGTITAKKAGTCTIKVKSKGLKTVKCKLTVKAAS